MDKEGTRFLGNLLHELLSWNQPLLTKSFRIGPTAIMQSKRIRQGTDKNTRLVTDRDDNLNPSGRADACATTAPIC